MPSYGYLCERCGNFHADNTISGRNKTECPKCGRACERDVEYELNSGYDLEIGVDHPRWSLSMGVPVSQLDHFRKIYPNSVYDDRGRLLVKNRKHKLRQADERNMCELD